MRVKKAVCVSVCMYVCVRVCVWVIVVICVRLVKHFACPVQVANAYEFLILIVRQMRWENLFAGLQAQRQRDTDTHTNT